ncbi:MAG TPA: class I SAM-dependent methyltransferase [Pyrinomonadaceae bacterium]|nr:class I SAM-dependent methyltransferase [Pyrinomonadaceae bacterium]HNU09441.1 class I SAM-dependent methyltransferase [Pyrinomonadaceae bacterium]
MNTIREEFGDIDIYVFDQIQKGRFTPGMRILDAGCGGGRNIIWFLKNGFEVFGIDVDGRVVDDIRKHAVQLAPGLPAENFQVATLESIPFEDGSFDWVICNTVLHFAEDRGQFDRMLAGMWRKLKPGGRFFARLASSIGIKDLLVPTSNGRYWMPDGTERFIVDEEILRDATANLGATFLEPIKTTNVENLRCMTTWVLTKPLT